MVIKMNRFFNLAEIQKAPSPVKREGVFSAYMQQHVEKIARVEDLLRIPNEGEVFYLYTENAFNAFTFLPWLAKRYFLASVYASTYSISRRVVEALQQMQQGGQIGEITLLISDSMPKRNPTTIDVLNGVVAANPNFQVQYSWNHSKVTLIHIKLEEQEFHLVLEGSGNWSENAQIEQYTLTNSPEVFHFFRGLFDANND